MIVYKTRNFADARQYVNYLKVVRVVEQIWNSADKEWQFKYGVFHLGRGRFLTKEEL